MELCGFVYVERSNQSLRILFSLDAALAGFQRFAVSCQFLLTEIILLVGDAAL